MRSTALLLVVGLFRTAHAIAHGYIPFSDTLFGLSNEALLVRRQNSCQSGYNSCGSLGASDVCCPQDTNCALDQAGNIACCPLNASCTGTIAGTRTGSVTSASGTNSGTSSGGFVLGGTTTSTTSTSSQTTSAQTTAGVAGGGSTVPNNFYPFIYIPTTYANADLCTSAFSSCQAESTSCLVSLAGQNGVTVSGFGGGITQQGATGTILSSASSICSSLSAQGCYGLQETQCTQFGTGSVPTGTATTTTGFVQVGNLGPRQTACAGMLYAAGAGAVLGAVEVLL